MRVGRSCLKPHVDPLILLAGGEGPRGPHPSPPSCLVRPTPRLHAPAAPGSRFPASSGGPSRSQSRPPSALRSGPAPRPLPQATPDCLGLPLPPPSILPASSSGTSRRCLCKTQVPQSRSRRPPPAFQAAHEPPLPLPAGSHFRQATAELAEVRRAGNGRTPAPASDGGHSPLSRQRPKDHPGLDGAAGLARLGTGAAAPPPGIVGNAAGPVGERPRQPLRALSPASYQCPRPCGKPWRANVERMLPSVLGRVLTPEPVMGSVLVKFKPKNMRPSS